MLPHQRQLVKKAPQMVRDEWTKAHFIGSQKNKMAECVFAAVQSCVENPVRLCCMHNMTNASCFVWEHHSGFGQLLVQFMIFFYDNGDQFSGSQEWNAHEHPTISLNDPSNQILPVRLSLKTLSSQMFITNFNYLIEK